MLVLRRSPAFVCVLLAAALCSCRHSAPVKSVGGYTLEVGAEAAEDVPDTIRLGRVRQGEVISKDIAVSNAADVPFMIKNFKTSCGCLLFDFSREPVVAGGQSIVEMRFMSAGYYGLIEREVAVLTSASSVPVTFVVQAHVE